MEQQLDADKKKARTRDLILLAGGALAAVVVASLFDSGGPPTGAAASPAPVAIKATPTPPKDEVSNATAAAAEPEKQDPPAKQADYATLQEAVDNIRPLMSDTVESASAGALLLTRWSMGRLKWSELSAMPKTRRSAVMKDSDSERGKVICTSGQIVEIQVEHGDNDDINTGILFTGDGSLYRFINVGDSGNIEEHSQAAMCGVATGKFDYRNSAGGAGHAILVVGMFDLPKNRRR